LIICVFLVILPILVTPKLVGVDLALLLAGVVVYFVFIKWKTKPVWLKRIFRELKTPVLSLLSKSLIIPFPNTVHLRGYLSLKKNSPISSTY
jgi:hypothetical protein